MQIGQCFLKEIISDFMYFKKQTLYKYAEHKSIEDPWLWTVCANHVVASVLLSVPSVT